MLLQRLYPTNPFVQLQRQVDRLFSDALGEVDRGWLQGSRGFPALNIWEDGERVMMEAEVPGLTMNDLEVQVISNEVTIKGRRNAARDENAVCHRCERGTGEFSRTVTLPVEVNADRVEAVLKNGVLSVTLPKAEAARARRIEVKPGS